eukprot:Platyproteum_vivax@DN1973_c0_g1_i1.p1
MEDTSKKARSAYQNSAVLCSAISTKPSMLFAGLRDGTLCCWNMNHYCATPWWETDQGAAAEPMFELLAHEEPVLAVSAGVACNQLAPVTASVASVRIWQIDGLIKEAHFRGSMVPFAETANCSILRLRLQVLNVYVPKALPLASGINTLPDGRVVAGTCSLAQNPLTGRLYAGTLQGLVFFWDLGDSEGVRNTCQLEAHTEPVEAMHCGHSLLTTCSQDGTLKLWDDRGSDCRCLHSVALHTAFPEAPLASDSAMAPPPLREKLTCLTVDPDEEHIAVGSMSGRVFVCSKTLQPISNWRVDGPLRALLFTNHHSLLVSCGFSHIEEFSFLGKLEGCINFDRGGKFMKVMHACWSLNICYLENQADTINRSTPKQELAKKAVKDKGRQDVAALVEEHHIDYHHEEDDVALNPVPKCIIVVAGEGVASESGSTAFLSVVSASSRSLTRIFDLDISPNSLER